VHCGTIALAWTSPTWTRVSADAHDAAISPAIDAIDPSRMGASIDQRVADSRSARPGAIAERTAGRFGLEGALDDAPSPPPARFDAVEPLTPSPLKLTPFTLGATSGWPPVAVIVTAPADAVAIPPPLPVAAVTGAAL
jgi:hypothetical protein